MSLSVDIQVALDEDSNIAIPDNEQIQYWASKAVSHTSKGVKDKAQMTVRIVNEEEITHLNSEYRHKYNETNVLSFPFISPPGIPENEVPDSLGDIVVCAAVVKREAEEQNKVETEHWAHMIVHGTLHLLGYDHQEEQAANEMEALEVDIMKELGFANPYE